MRRDLRPLLATIPLVIVSLASVGALIASDPAGSSDEPAIYKLILRTTYPVKPVSVGNASWQLALHVENQGNREYVFDKVYINGMLVEVVGLIHGDTLSSSSAIGTSIPVGGLALSPNHWVTVYVWVGSNLYTKGTRLTIELQEPGQPELRKIVVLR